MFGRRPRSSTWALIAFMCGIFLLSGPLASAQTTISQGPYRPAYWFGDTGTTPRDLRHIRPFLWSWDFSFTALLPSEIYDSQGPADGEFLSFAPGLSVSLDPESNANLQQPRAMALHPDGDALWIAAYESNKILSLDLDTREFAVVYDGNTQGELSGPWDIGFAQIASGTVCYVTSRDNNKLLKLDTSGNFVSSFTHINLNDPTGLAIEPTNPERVVVVSTGTNRVFWTAGVDALQEHPQTPAFSAMLNDPMGIDYDSTDNALYLANSGDGRVLRLPCSSCDDAPEVIVGPDDGQGGAFDTPTDLICSSSDGGGTTLYVLDEGPNRIYRVFSDATRVDFTGDYAVDEMTGLFMDPEEGDLIVASAVGGESTGGSPVDMPHGAPASCLTDVVRSGCTLTDECANDQGNCYIVDSSGENGDYTTIQAAIDAFPPTIDKPFTVLVHGNESGDPRDYAGAMVDRIGRDGVACADEADCPITIMANCTAGVRDLVRINERLYTCESEGYYDRRGAMLVCETPYVTIEGFEININSCSATHYALGIYGNSHHSAGRYLIARSGDNPGAGCSSGGGAHVIDVRGADDITFEYVSVLETATTGSSADCIHFEEADRVTIRNGSFCNSHTNDCISTEIGSDYVIENVRTENCSAEGIELASVSDVSIDDVIVTNATRGIEVAGGENVTVNHGEIYDILVYAMFINAPNVDLSLMYIHDNDDYGTFFDDASINSSITESVYDNNYKCMRMDPDTFETIDHNLFSNNYRGLYLPAYEFTGIVEANQFWNNGTDCYKDYYGSCVYAMADPGNVYAEPPGQIFSGTEAGTLVTFPYDVTVTVTVSDGPPETILGVNRARNGGGHFGPWLWANGGATDQVSFRGQRDEELWVYLGWVDSTGSGSSSIVAVADPDEILPRPTLEAYSSLDAPGAITVEVDHSNGDGGDTVDEIQVYLMTFCEWEIENEEEGGDGVWESIDNVDLRQCFVPVERSAPNVDGTTIIDIDDLPFVPGETYYFAATVADDETGYVSAPSELDLAASGTEPSAGGPSGATCGTALTAIPHQAPNTSHPLPSGTASDFVWYRHTASGDSDTEYFFIGEVFEDHDECPLITAYDDCPSSGGNLLAEGEDVAFAGNGGDTFYFRVVNPNDGATTWSFHALETSPSSDLPSVLNLTATGGDGGPPKDGMIAVCWDPVEAVTGVSVPPEIFHYRVERVLEDESTVVLAADWRDNCYYDWPLAELVERTYQVTPILQWDPVSATTIDGVTSSTVTGQSSAVATGPEYELSTPIDFNVQYQPPAHRAVFDWLAGVQVWWDAGAAGTEYRVEEVNKVTGQTRSFLISGGAHAALLPANDLGAYCYNVYTRRDLGDGTEESAGAGWSASGDTQYCYGPTDVPMVDVDMGSDEDTVYQESMGAVSYHEWETGGYEGPAYVAAYGGDGVTICVYQENSEGDMVQIDCAEPDANGNTVLEYTASSDSPVVIEVNHWDGEDETLPDAQDTDTEIIIGTGDAPSNSNPVVSLSFADAACGSTIELTYSITNWTPDGDSFVRFWSKMDWVADRTSTSGTVTLPLDISSSITEMEVQLFDGPGQERYSRDVYATASSLMGDVNTDCRINVIDAILIINHILGESLLADAVQPLADLNGSASINILDVVALVQAILDAMES